MGETVEETKINGVINGTHEETESMEVDSEHLPDPSELKKNLLKDSENSKGSEKNGSDGNGDSEREPENGNGGIETKIADDRNEPVVNDDSQDEVMDVDGKNLDDNEEDNENDSPELLSNDDSSNAEKVTKQVKNNEAPQMKIQEVSEAVVLSDSDDEDDDSDSSSSKLKSGTQSSAVSDSENGISNCASSTNPSRLEDYDDDKPVSIHSDSDEESTANKQPNGAKSNESSDKEDCILIDDDEKKDSNRSSPRANSRKHDQNDQEYDDDIEEIIEDPLENSNPPKRMKIGNTTIDLTNKKSDGTKKEPSLVVIDTDTIIQKRQSGNFPINLSVHSTNSSSSTSSSASQALNLSKTGSAYSSQSTNLLPNLTDDMFVLEAPSFIVPYIYEKPPTADLKEVITKMGAEIEAQRKKEKEKRMREEGIDSDDDEKSEKVVEIPQKPKEVAAVPEETKEKKKGKRRRNPNGDESWDEFDTSTDEEASDSEQRTKVLIKEADLDNIKTNIISADNLLTEKKSDSYFDSPLGKFFMTIGVNLVQEYVQSDLLRQQRRKREREGKEPSQATQIAINSLMKNLEMSKENNAPFKHKLKRCEFCPFKTESALVLAHHYETPHLRGNIYKCNFCSFETRPAHEILYHMEALHNVKGKLEKPLSYHQCPNCPFEDNGKSKLARHEVACAKKFKPEINLNPPLDWEPPAKIPKIKAKHGLVGAATAYQAMAAQQQQRMVQAAAVAANVNKLNLTQTNAAAIAAANAMRNRGRPQTVTKATAGGTVMRGNQFKTQLNNSLMLSNNYQLAAATLAAANSSLLQQAQKLALLSSTSTTAYLSSMNSSSSSNKSKAGGSTPSISITPLPRQQTQAGMKPGQNPNASSSKAQFVICEICDGYIKDLDQLRNHMQWIHKVKIHPKMIYNRPPLNCQKCQFRFFTDQGLERHLLGSHGLVTSSMQEAANKGKDSGRCPVCGKVYQWKLLNHVSRDHNMTLKPAHLSYKCTVCTATFGMYKQFESHVYSAHSTVAKKDNKSKSGGGSSSSMVGSSSSSSNSLLKPLKINDEITIIPQPGKSRNSGRLNELESHVID